MAVMRSYLPQMRKALLLVVVAFALAGCGSAEPEWSAVPGGQTVDLDVSYRGVELSCFVFDGDYAGNLECRRRGERRASERIVVPADGSWVNFSVGRVRAVEALVRGQARACLQYDGDYKGSLNCPDELNA